MTTTTELDLIERMRHKDATALDEFHQLYRARILAVARKFVSDSWDAEEVLQDVLWSVYRKIDSFRGDANFWSWVYRVTQNAARMHLRKHRRDPLPLEQPDIESAMRPVRRSDFRPDELTIAHRAMERLVHALGELDPVNRELYEALEVNGEDRARVASRMGMTMSALKSRLHRIRQTLRMAFNG